MVPRLRFRGSRSAFRTCEAGSHADRSTKWVKLTRFHGVVQEAVAWLLYVRYNV